MLRGRICEEGSPGVWVYPSVSLSRDKMHSKCTLDEGLDDSEGSWTWADGEAENSVPGTDLGWGSYTLCLQLLSPPASIQHLCQLRASMCFQSDSFSDSSCLLLFWVKALGLLGTDTGSSRLSSFPLIYTHICMMFRFSGSTPAAASSPSGKAVSYG